MAAVRGGVEPGPQADRLVQYGGRFLENAENFGCILRKTSWFPRCIPLCRPLYPKSPFCRHKNAAREVLDCGGGEGRVQSRYERDVCNCGFSAPRGRDGGMRADVWIGKGMEMKMNAMKPIRLAVAAAVLAAAAVAEAAVMPYGTYLVKGTFRGEYNTVLRDFGEAAVRAQRADGTVIAEAVVADADAEGVNFVLAIPVSSVPTARSCEVGEWLDCVLWTPEGTLDVPNSLQVDSPVRVGKVTFNCAEVAEFTNPADGSVVEIPVDYIAEAQAFLDALGEGKTYDPWADYDGDGACNYAEFLAGTIPFDETDFLHVTGFAAAEEGKLALRFEHVGGHVYAVSASDSLAQPGWGRQYVRRGAAEAELEQVVAAGEDGEPGETEIFIVPADGATGGFFRVEAQ